VKAVAPEGVYTPRMKKHFEEVVRAEMTKQFGYKNALEVPVIDKIVLNMGVGEAVNDSKRSPRRGRSRPDRGSEACHHQGFAWLFRPQGSREHADRRQGHLAQDPNV